MGMDDFIQNMENKNILMEPVVSDQVQVPFEISIEDAVKDLGQVRNLVMQIMDLHDRTAWANSPHDLLASFRVFSAGIFTQAWHHRHSREGLEEGVLIYCTAGKGYYRQGDQQWCIKPNDVLYCPPSSRHEYWADDEEPWSICWAHLSGPRLADYERLLELIKDGPVRHIGVGNNLPEAFRRMIQLFGPPYSDRQLLAIQSEAIGILGALAAIPQTMGTFPVQTQFVQEMKRLMEAQLHLPFDLAALAKSSGYHPGYFIRLFRQVEGVPPGLYFNRRKMHHACSLLIDPNLQIQKIAELVGFSDPLYFSKAFKKIIGTSPAAYRRLNRE
jgi:AraC family transcriptional regulator, arabinose operon regulatory protein